MVQIKFSKREVEATQEATREIWGALTEDKRLEFSKRLDLILLFLDTAKTYAANDLLLIPVFDGQRLRALRQEQDISADKLSQMTHLCTRHIWRLEGNKRPHAAAITVGKLARALNTSIEYLLGLTDEPDNPFANLKQATPIFDGQRLRALRREQGISADKLGRMAHLSTRHIWRLESNKRPRVAAITVGKITYVLNTSIEYLLGLTDESGNPFTKPEQSSN